MSEPDSILFDASGKIAFSADGKIRFGQEADPCCCPPPGGSATCDQDNPPLGPWKCTTETFGNCGYNGIPKILNMVIAGWCYWVDPAGAMAPPDGDGYGEIGFTAGCYVLSIYISENLNGPFGTKHLLWSGTKCTGSDPAGTYTRTGGCETTIGTASVAHI